MAVANCRRMRGWRTFLIILAIGTLLRFYNLGSVIFWGDDPIHQVRVAYQPLWFVIAHNNQTALSTLLVHFLLLLGNIEFMARLGSAVFGVLAILFVFILGKTLFSKTEGLAAAAFVSLSPFLIQFSQYSRAYSLFVFLSILSLYFFYRAWQENQRRYWLLFSLITGLAIYNHLMALLLLPVYASFIGLLWLKSRIKKADETEILFQNMRLKSFLLWAFGILVVNAILYWPNAGVRGFLFFSANRAVARPSGGSVSFWLIDYILRLQIPIPAVCYLTLIFAAIGLAASFKKYPRQALLCALYLIVPYVIFVVINPRENNALSAYRFFIFILPLLFLLTARGLVVMSTFATLLIASRRPVSAFASRKALVGILAILMAGGYFAGFKGYYLNFWRLGSLKISPEVAEYLRKNVKSDALIYFDIFPVSSLNMIVNPLTKDLLFKEVEYIIRNHANPRPDNNDLLLYYLNWQEFRVFVAGRDVELWVVAELNSKNQRALREALRDHSSITLDTLHDHVVLRFHRNGRSVAQKLARMTELFLSLSLEKPRIKHFHLLAAKSCLMIHKTEDGYRELAAYRKIQLSSSEIKFPQKNLVYRVFDWLFGLKDTQLRALHDERLLFEIRRFLYREGNRYLSKNKPERALFAYLECLKWGNDMNNKILENLSALQSQLFLQGRLAEEALLCQKAVEINPQRYDFRFALAEIYRKMGDSARAEEEYKKAFGLASLPSHFLQEISLEPETAVIWENNGEWHLLFRSEKKCAFSGTITAGKKIRALNKFNFLDDDVLKASAYKISFLLRTDPGIIKTFRFNISPKADLSFDLKTDGIRDARKIIILPGSSRIPKIPFSLN